MRKTLVFILVVFVLSLPAVSVVGAQRSTPLEFGQWVEGSLTNQQFENEFTFSASAGDLVMIEMTAKPGTYDLDPYIILVDGQNNIIGENDTFSYPVSLVLAQLESDGEYVVVATRSGGRTGNTQGDYVLRVSKVEPLSIGSVVEVTINDDGTNDVNDIPTSLVIALAESGPVKIGFSQVLGPDRSRNYLYGSLKLLEYDATRTFSGRTLMEINNTATLTGASFTADLVGGQWYVLTVSGGYSFASGSNPKEATVTVTLN